VAQQAPSYSFNPTGFHSIPNFGQNSIAPYPFSNIAPTSPSSAYQFGNPSPAAYSLPVQKPSFSYSYNVLPSQYPTIPQPQPVPASYVQPTSAPLSFPPTSSAYNHPVTSFFKFRGSSPYAFEQFGLSEKHGEYPYHQLNAGETLPHSGGSYVNINFDGGSYASEVYQPTRYLRSSIKNGTSLFQQ